MIFGIWMLVLGALAVPNLILKKPELKPALDKLTPYQGWIGAGSALWGVWGMINAVLHLNWLSLTPIWWITMAGTAALTFGLGMLLGVGTLKTFIKDEKAQARMDELVTKLAPYQGNLGVAALVLGGWCIVASILFHR